MIFCIFKLHVHLCKNHFENSVSVAEKKEGNFVKIAEGH
jgi:hypothetical protein